MTTRRTITWAALVCGLAAAMTTTVQAQYPGVKGLDLKSLPEVKLRGRLYGVRANMVELSADAVQVVFPKQTSDSKLPPKLTDAGNLKSMRHAVLIDDKTRLTVSASTTPDALKPGQGVQFSGKIDDKGVVAGDIKLINLFVPEADFKPLLTVSTAFNGFLADTPETVAPFQAEGVLFSYRNGEMVVLIDNNRRLTAKVAADAVVNVAGSSLSLAQDGDQVTVTGRLFKPGQIIGETVSIALTHLAKPKPEAPAGTPAATTPPATATPAAPAKTPPPAP